MRRLLPWLLVPALALGAGVCAWTVLQLPAQAEGLGPLVQASLDASGVAHPVTAVLLNFRGYDTLLELFVLFIAALGVRALGLPTLVLEGAQSDPVLEHLAQWLAPLLLLVAVYLLWVGAVAPGGAFQAGSVLGGAGVLLLLSFPERFVAPMRARLPWLLAPGPLVFLLVAVATLLARGRLLDLPPDAAGLLILLIELCATVSIAATLLLLFAGARARP